MTRVEFRARLAGPLLALLFGVACGSDTTTEKTIGAVPQSPKIVAFEASPPTIVAGETSALVWATSDAVSISIADEAGHPVSIEGVDIASGSISVSPTKTTSYTLAAGGVAGVPGPATRTITVTVDTGPADSPVIETFTASPERITVGDTVTLSWRTSNTTALTLKDDAGVEVPLGDLSVSEGSVGVKPTRSPTIYTLIATGGGRRVTGGVSVAVDGLPRVHRFSVDPIQPVAAGATVRLIWETSRADRVVIEDEGGGVVVDTADGSGVHSLPLEKTTEFRVTATRNGAEATAMVLAQVGAEILEFTASPRVARVGDPIALSWKTAGAEAVILTGPGGFRQEVNGAEASFGATRHLLVNRGDYILHARHDDVVRTWAIFVEATEAPRIRSLTSDLSILTAASDHPKRVNLSYVQDGGTSCTLYRNGIPVPGKTGFACLPAGSIEVEVTGTSELRLVAVNYAGNHQANVHVDAVEPARVGVFTKDPIRRLGPGGTVELAWQVTDAARVWMKRDDTTFAIGDTEFVGTRSATVYVDTMFTLFAENSLGDITSVALPVLAGTPVISEFQVVPRVAAPSDPLTFTWSCDGGDSLELAGWGGAVLTTGTEPALIDHGSVSGRAPATPTSTAYTLTVENGASNPAVAAIELLVTDGPLVRSLTSSETEIALGGTVDIAWVVANDAAGNRPTLTLTDNFGNTYDLTGLDPNSDKTTIHPEEEGRHEFTLTATTTGTRPSRNDVDPLVVEVTVASKIVSFNADPSSVFTLGGSGPSTSQLQWETANAVDLSIFEATAAGEAIPPALHRVSLEAGDLQAELDAGSFDVQPLATTHYLLRVANRIGATVERTVSILADPPIIEKFEPNDTDLIVGESTTLAWATKNATVAAIQPMAPVVTALPADPNRFVDISNLSGAEYLALTGTDTSVTVTFPPGFRFPFDGEFFRQVRVTSNGYLSFALDSTAASSSNVTMPTSSTYRYVHLAVWWDYLSGNNSGVVGSAWWRFDENDRTITIMWKDWSYRYTSATFDYNFEVILHENGSFEYRYGDFSTNSTSSTYINYTKGSSATIGFQDLAGASYNVVSNNTALPNGPNHLAWFFDLATPVSGTRQVTPPSNRTYKLSAANDDIAVSQETQVKVWPVPTIGVASVYPSAPQLDAPFTISWQASQATRIRIVDEQGTVLCEESNPAKVSMGSCTLTQNTTGTRSWQVQAVNGIDRNLVTRPMVFSVYPPLTIDKFSVSDVIATSGQEVTVTWAGHGGFGAELYECTPKTNRSNCAPINISGQNPNGGTYRTTVTNSREYWLRLIDRQGRAEEAMANVWVDIPKIDQLTSSTLQTTPGGSVTLTWNASGSSASMTNYPVPNPRETGEPFINIANTGTPVPLTGSSDLGYFVLDFKSLPQPFAFPYFGKSYTGLIAKVDGVITFDMTDTTSATTNYTMPNTTSTKVEIAPFWDDLVTGASGKFQWELRSLGGVKFLILQWTAFGLYTSTAPSSNLNFQVLLWENGDIDFRYAEMSATGTTPTLADGSSGTMGIQGKTGTWGQMLTTAYNTAMPGGLDNRSWRFAIAPPVSGQTVVKPTQSTTYRLCVTNASLYDVCQERRVVVVGGGDLLISEIMIRPTSPAGEWFELRNLSTDPIDLAGFGLTSGSTGAESFTIPATPPVIVQPGGFAILARSDSVTDNGGVSPTVVYGEAIDLADTADDVALLFGTTTIDRLMWTNIWNIPTNKSIMLEPSKFDRVEGANDGTSSWCASPKVYGGGFYGNPGALGPGCLTGGENDFYLLDPMSGMPWIDISQTGTALNAIWDAPYQTPPIALGFGFPYFGTPVTEMTITKYGAIALTPPVGTLPTSNSAIPSASTQPNGLVAPMWDTMYNAGTGAIRYQVRNVGEHLVMVVQWNEISPTSTTGAYGLANFQLQLWDSGDIVFVYADPTPPGATYANYTYIYGAAATIGIENNAGDLAYQIYTGTVSEGVRPAYSGRSYRFIPR